MGWSRAGLAEGEARAGLGSVPEHPLAATRRPRVPAPGQALADRARIVFGLPNGDVMPTTQCSIRSMMRPARLAAMSLAAIGCISCAGSEVEVDRPRFVGVVRQSERDRAAVAEFEAWRATLLAKLEGLRSADAQEAREREAAQRKLGDIQTAIDRREADLAAAGQPRCTVVAEGLNQEGDRFFGRGSAIPDGAPDSHPAWLISGPIVLQAPPKDGLVMGRWFQGKLFYCGETRVRNAFGVVMPAKAYCQRPRGASKAQLAAIAELDRLSGAAALLRKRSYNHTTRQDHARLSQQLKRVERALASLRGKASEAADDEISVPTDAQLPRFRRAVELSEMAGKSREQAAKVRYLDEALDLDPGNGEYLRALVHAERLLTTESE